MQGPIASIQSDSKLSEPLLPQHPSSPLHSYSGQSSTLKNQHLPMASTAAFPPGGTYFDTAKRSFTAVAINESNDRAIATTEFLEAAETVAGLFDVLGSVAFSPVKKDMTGNIKVSNLLIAASWK